MRTLLLGLVGCGAVAAGWALAESPSKPLTEPTKGALPPADNVPPPAVATDIQHVERVLASRKEYENSLKAIYEHYAKVGDKQRLQWAERELMAYHMLWKPSYNLDVKDVPPPTLEARVNVKDANELYRTAMEYKGKGFGDDYVLNMRRAELLLREVLDKYPNSDKIGDVAYQLGDIYEGRAYKQYDRAAKYFERSTQWVKGTRTDARLRAATLYDRQLNERAKAIDLYRAVVDHDTNPERIKQAEKRLAELTGRK
ncbi:MAG: tetratricopeptide repeat protein [Planctomycetes bacterium]|nr:tetratricopeptide repeat protein [Planctomycetota bacterium]